MGQEFRPQQLDAGGRTAAPAALSRGWSIAGARVTRWPVLIVSVLFGIAAALATVVLSGVLDAGFGSGRGGYWPVSALLIATVSGAWLAGAILAVRMLIGLPRWDRGRALFIPRWIGALVAFGFGPLLAVLFFVAIGVGGEAWNGAPLPALGVTALVLALFAYARSAVVRLGEMLLVSLFVWLAVLVLPAFWSDPVSRLFADFLLGLMRGAGLL